MQFRSGNFFFGVIHMSLFIHHKFKIGLALVLIAVMAGGILIKGHPVASQDEAPASPWSVRCSEGEDKSCEIFQRLVVKETGQRVAEFAIGFPDGKKEARGVVILPLGILLPEGARMQIDDGQPFKFKVRYCTQQGCFAFLNLNKELLGKLRKGDAATVIFKNLEGQDLSVGMSLDGFTKSLKELS